MYTVTRTLPDGTVKTQTAPDIRHAGATIADVLYLNAGLSKRRATQIGMQAERTMYAQSDGYTFSIEQGAK